MNKALEALKEIEWMDVDEKMDQLCPVCGRSRFMQHAQWCRLDRAIGFLVQEAEWSSTQPAVSPNRQAWDKMAKATKAGEFTKRIRTAIKRYRMGQVDVDVDWAINEFEQACDIIDCLEKEAKTTVGTNVRLKAEYNKLQAQLTVKDKIIREYEEQK